MLVPVTLDSVSQTVGHGSRRGECARILQGDQEMFNFSIKLRRKKILYITTALTVKKKRKKERNFSP